MPRLLGIRVRVNKIYSQEVIMEYGVILKKTYEVKKYIDKNPCTNLNVNEIAKKIELNPKVLSEKFAYYCGVTIKKYILNKKRNKFMEIIRKRKPGTPLNISNLAYKLGFNSSSSFCNFVKRSMGKTCTELLN